MAVGYSKSALLFVAMGTLIEVSVSAAPNFILDPTRIYTPDDIDELRTAIAYKECQENPNCNTNSFGIPELRCNVGAGVDGMLKEMVNVRTGGTCNPFTGEVVWPPTGQCVHLLTQGPCPNGFWIKLKSSDLQPVCEPRPCENNQGLMGNNCLMMEDRSTCPFQQSLVNNEFGEAECDCESGKAYHALTQACYTPYSQGPCPTGQIIKVLDKQSSGKAECSPNVCPAENMVMIDDQCQVQEGLSNGEIPRGTCYHLDTKGPCTTDGGILTIDTLLMEPVCLLQTETHSIFNLPFTRGCSRGSIRDGQGRCRRNFSQFFQNPPPVVTSRPGVGGRICPRGQVLLGGNCYRLSG